MYFRIVNSSPALWIIIISAVSNDDDINNTKKKLSKTQAHKVDCYLNFLDFVQNLTIDSTCTYMQQKWH